MRAFIDASVAVKWFVAESGRATARVLLEDHVERIAPSILTLEVANALRRKAALGEVTLAQARMSLAELPAFISYRVDCDDLVEQAFSLGVELQHPIADCVYLACARSGGACVVTADQKFYMKAAPAHGDFLRLLDDLAPEPADRDTKG